MQDALVDKVKAYMKNRYEFIFGKPHKVLFADYLKWSSTTLPQPDSFESNFKQIISKERTKSWFKQLLNNQREGVIKEKLQRNEKIRKIIVKPEIEFFSDEGILLYICQFLPTISLMQMRQSCHFLKNFFSTHFSVISNNRTMPFEFYSAFGINSTLTVRIKESEEQLVQQYKHLCLLSNIEAEFVEQIITDITSHSRKVLQVTRDKSFVKLLEATMYHFVNLVTFRFDMMTSLARHSQSILLEKICHNIFIFCDRITRFPSIRFPNSPLQFWYIEICDNPYLNVSFKQQVDEYSKFIASATHPTFLMIDFRNIKMTEEMWNYIQPVTNKVVKVILFSAKEVQILIPSVKQLNRITLPSIIDHLTLQQRFEFIVEVLTSQSTEIATIGKEFEEAKKKCGAVKITK